MHTAKAIRTGRDSYRVENAEGTTIGEITEWHCRDGSVKTRGGLLYRAMPIGARPKIDCVSLSAAVAYCDTALFSRHNLDA